MQILYNDGPQRSCRRGGGRGDGDCRAGGGDGDGDGGGSAGGWSGAWSPGDPGGWHLREGGRGGADLRGAGRGEGVDGEIFIFIIPSLEKKYPVFEI